MIKFDPNLFLACGQGCLRGAAFFAATGKSVMEGGEDIDLWPWLMQLLPAPPNTRYSEDGLTEARHCINAIAWAVETGDWTLEQAVDWVRQHEPSEPDQEQSYGGQNAPTRRLILP